MSCWLSGSIRSSVQRSSAVQDRVPANHSLRLCLPSDRMQTTNPVVKPMTAIHLCIKTKVAGNILYHVKIFFSFMISFYFLFVVFIINISRWSITKQIIYINVFTKTAYAHLLSSRIGKPYFVSMYNDGHTNRQADWLIDCAASGTYLFLMSKLVILSPPV